MIKYLKIIKGSLCYFSANDVPSISLSQISNLYFVNSAFKPKFLICQSCKLQEIGIITIISGVKIHSLPLSLNVWKRYPSYQNIGSAILLEEVKGKEHHMNLI